MSDTPTAYVWVCERCKAQYPVVRGERSDVLLVVEDGQAPMPTRQTRCICSGTCVLTSVEEC